MKRQTRYVIAMCWVLDRGIGEWMVVVIRSSGRENQQETNFAGPYAQES